MWVDVKGLGDADAVEWSKTFPQFKGTPVEVRDAITFTDGRPALLEQWFLGAELQVEVKKLTGRVEVSYQQRLQKLTRHSLDYFVRLCILPSTMREDPECRSVADGRAPDFSRSACEIELKNTLFLVKSADGRLNPHDAVRNQVLISLGEPSCRELARELVERLRTGGFALDRHELAMLDLYRLAGYEADASRLASHASKDLLRQQNPTAAIAAADVGLLVQEETMAAAERISLSLIKSEGLIRTGRYVSALDLLAEIGDASPSVDDQKSINFHRLIALIRLNRYDDALSLAELIDDSLPADDTVRRTELNRRYNLIFRDLHDEEAATATALALQASINPGMSAKSASEVMRSVARTFALFAPEKALEPAQQALEFASKTASAREVGNSYLAVGEAYRHNGNFEACIIAYKKAIRYANLTGNTDSLIWSMLGWADAEILKGDFGSAESLVSQLSPFFDADEARHPLESLHWKLTRYEIQLMRGGVDIRPDKIIEDYDAIGITWPSEYVAELQKTRIKQPKPI